MKTKRSKVHLTPEQSIKNILLKPATLLAAVGWTIYLGPMPTSQRPLFQRVTRTATPLAMPPNIGRSFPLKNFSSPDHFRLFSVCAKKTRTASFGCSSFFNLLLKRTCRSTQNFWLPFLRKKILRQVFLERNPRCTGSRLVRMDQRRRVTSEMASWSVVKSGIAMFFIIITIINS